MNNNPDSQRTGTWNDASFKRAIFWGMLFFACAVTGIYLSRPLYDPDFYWHLKTGQWIWQHKSLPHVDPFGIPPLAPASPRTDFILSSYWLSQLILYAFYSAGGMSAIILLRWIYAGISLLIFAYWTNLRNRDVTVVISIGTILLLEYYFIERPQFISFVCFGALLTILFRFLDHPHNRSLWSMLTPLSLVMTIWANMHGGFLIGQALLIYFIIAEGIKFTHSSLRPLSVRDFRILLISSITALGASFINPNAIDMINYLPTIFDADNYANVNNLEEMSIVEFFRESRNYTNLLYIASMALTAAALLASKHRKDITWVGILTGTAFMGCQHMRLMPFFLVSATIFLTKYVETERPAVTSRLVIYAMLAVTTVYCVKNEFPRIMEVTRSGWVPPYHFPVRSADYISSQSIAGNIYTTMIWGGYMIWRAGPDTKIFHDGRILNLLRAWEYNNSTVITMDQRPYWKGLFNARNIRVVVLPIYEDNGDQNMLAQSISSDREWSIVFAAENEVVFVKSR